MSDCHPGKFSKMGGKCLTVILSNISKTGGKYTTVILANFQKREENVQLSSWQIFKNGRKISVCHPPWQIFKNGRKMSDCHHCTFSKTGVKCLFVFFDQFSKIGGRCLYVQFDNFSLLQLSRVGRK